MLDLSFLSLLGPEWEWFPRNCMTSASKGQAPVYSKEHLLAKLEEAGYVDCFLATHTSQDKQKGILRVVFIDLDFPGDLARAQKVVERVYSHIERAYGIRPYCQFSGSKGYHIIIPIKAVEAGAQAKPFLKYLQIRLSRGYCDPQILGDIVRLFRIPNTINSKSGRLCEKTKEWDGNVLDVSLLWEEFKMEEIDRLLKERNKPKSWLCQGQARKRGGIRPQILELMRRMEEGQNLTHRQRFAVLTELIAEGWDDQQILNLYSKLPDFKEGKTRAIINHARRVGYSPFKNATLEETIRLGAGAASQAIREGQQ